MTSFGALALMFIAALASYLGKRLTAKGAIVGWLIGCFLFLGCGWAAVLSMALFFGLAVAATATGRREKEQEGIAEQNKGRRSAYQVFANGGLAGILGFWAWIWPLSEAYCLMFCASAFASATADTLSSELGSVYGKRFYHIIGFKPAQKGLNGVVSLEGSLFGILGSILIAAAYVFSSGEYRYFWLIVMAGTAGNIIDSILGATQERKGRLGNDAVNFLNTLGAVLTACLLWIAWD